MTPPPRINQRVRQRIPDRDWEKIDRHCEVVFEMFRDPGPKSLVRCGDGEMKILVGGNSQSPKIELADSIRHADCLGLPGDDGGGGRGPEWRASIINALRDHYQTPVDPSALIGTNLFQLAPGLVGRLTAHKRVVWITSDADVIVNHLDDPAFRSFYELHEIAENHSINAAPGGYATPEPVGVSWKQSFADIRQRLTETPDFDLALVGAGVTGKLVCHHIKTALGRAAIDIGVIMSLLRGSRDRKQLRPDRALGFLVWNPSQK